MHEIPNHENNPNSLHCLQYRTEQTKHDTFHSHNCGQFMFYLDGEGIIYTPTVLARLSPDRGFWIPPGCKHRSVSTRLHHYHSLYIKAKMCDGLPTEPCIKMVSPLLRQLIIDVPKWKTIWDSSDIEFCKAKVITNEIANAPNMPLSVSSSDERRLAPLCQAIIDDPTIKWSLAEWGNKVGASEKTLSRLFKKELGTSFHQWRQGVRMMHAVSLLSQQVPIAEIANKVSYNSTSSFNAAFLAYFGKKTSDFMKI